MLMVLLVAVIFAMQEAGKPQRWMWMGFDTFDSAPRANDFLIDAGSDHTPTRVDGQSDWAIANSSTRRPANQTQQRLGEITDLNQRLDSSRGTVGHSSSLSLDPGSDNRVKYVSALRRRRSRCRTAPRPTAK